MKRLISLILLVCMLGAGLSAWAEEGAAPEAEDTILMTPGAGYSFDFILKLHPEAFSDAVREKVAGYAELLEALRFQGSFAWALAEESFELRLKVIPVNYPEGAVDLWIHGAEDLMYLHTSLFGDQKIKLSYFSMLGFCAKMAEHLGIPLQYLALAYPYTWKYSLRLPLQDWQGMVEKEDAEGVIPADAVRYLYDCWLYRVNEDESLKLLLDTLCKDTDLEDTLRAVTLEVPEYFVKNTLQEQEIRIDRQADGVRWHTAGGDIYTETRTEKETDREIHLPWMESGYHPVFALDTYEEKESFTSRLWAQLVGAEEGQDIVNLQASLISFPRAWPADCYSLLSFSLTGGLLPNAGAACYLSGEKNGHFLLEARKPTVDMEPGAVMLTAEGEVLPLEEGLMVEEFNLVYNEDALDLFVANDAVINAFLPTLVEPLAKGMLRFLVGVPTAACQAIMDDLTSLGVFEVLMGQ